MSYYSYFGAYTSFSAEDRDFLTEVAEAQSEFYGCSRSAAFQKACRALLEAAPSHDLLRFLSDETAIHRISTPSGVTMFTPIEPITAEQCVAQLSGLLLYCRNKPEELGALWFEHLGGYPTKDIWSAVNTSKICKDLNSESHHGDDGDSPYFAIAALTTLRDAITRARSSESTLVYYSWQRE